MIIIIIFFTGAFQKGRGHNGEDSWRFSGGGESGRAAGGGDAEKVRDVWRGDAVDGLECK